MIKKIISISTAFALTFGALSFSFAAEDVTSDDKLNHLIKSDIVNGYTDGTLRLENNSITRAEISSVIAKLAVEGDELEDYKGYSDFEDVEEGTWASPFVNVLFDKGIVTGYTDDTFRPADNIGYDEAIVMLVRSLDVEVEEGKTWSEGYINKAKELGVLEGIEIKDYSEKTNRKKIFEMIYNTLEINK